MDEVLTGVKRVFWAADEKRLRALFRIPTALALVWFGAVLVNTLLAGVTSLVAIPAPLYATLWIGLLSVFVVAVAWFIDRRYRRDIGMGLDRGWWRDAMFGLAAGLAMVLAVVGALTLAGLATVDGAVAVTEPDIRLGGSATAALVYGALFFGSFALLEELLVRGYLLTNVAEGLRGYVGGTRRAVWAAVGGTALLFGLLHAANPGGTLLGLVNITLAGVLLGVAYAATGRLAFPIGLHITWNFGLGALFGLPVSGLRTDTAVLPVRVEGPQLLTGGSFGPEGGLVMLLALAVGAGTLLGVLRRQDGQFTVESIAVPDLWIGDDS